jgi:hypothetical protein
MLYTKIPYNLKSFLLKIQFLDVSLVLKLNIEGVKSDLIYEQPLTVI